MGRLQHRRRRCGHRHRGKPDNQGESHEEAAHVVFPDTVLWSNELLTKQSVRSGRERQAPIAYVVVDREGGSSHGFPGGQPVGLRPGHEE
jgi:hypothetical protein